MAASTRPIDIIKKSPSSSTRELQDELRGEVSVSRSPSSYTIHEDYIGTPTLPRARVKSRPNFRLGLPHKWRPISDYELCDTEVLKKHGIVKPEATYNTFNVYIKKKDREKLNPTFYFIKFNRPGSYLSEFEALNAAMHNLLVPDIIPSAHVIYDDNSPGNPPIAICTAFEKSFVPVKKKAVTKDDLKNPAIVKSLANIITLAQLLEECDLHGNNFVWSNTAHPIMRVDPGQAMWNYLTRNPKTAPELKSLIWGTAEDIFPLSVEEVESEPNFKSASPRYCPGGSGKKSIFSDGSSYLTWFSKNAFTKEELEVYRDPNNLQRNPDFNYTKFKIDTKFTYLNGDVIKALARLYLREGYGLCLMSETVREPNKIYIDTNSDELIYEVVSNDDKTHDGYIPWYDLPTDFPKDPAIIIKMKEKWLPIILKHTTKAGHTLALSEEQMLLQHADEYADHLTRRITQLRETLIRSEQFKAFVKSALPRAMNEIFDDIDTFSEKIAKKIKRPQTSKAYARLFACQDPENPQAPLSEDAIKQKGRALDKDTLKPKA